ncbi:MAG: hypothetical protein SFW36_24050, partial [Leptolyngbyaceae cyanobacterium bins.59]|nr:hypothetical protein [Leptolyngbyaceae cyanobacterium bins.59]
MQLLPMSVSDPPPVGQASLATWGALNRTIAPQVPGMSLCPGEVGELLIRLEYRGETPLPYCIQLSGEIPESWYTLHSEGLDHRLTGDGDGLAPAFEGGLGQVPLPGVEPSGEAGGDG